MTVKINGTNTAAAPGYAGDDADTGLQCGTNELKLVTGGTARATVDSSGNLGIGVASPDVKLDIQANGSDNYPAIELLNSTGTGSSIRSKKSLVLEADYDNNSAGSQSTILFTTDGSERMRILANGGLTFNGDTAAANALDDYEEGDWTPTILGSSIVYANQVGRYTKIGNIVHIHAAVQISSGTVSSSFSILTGLPFTTRSSDYNKMTIATNGGNWNGGAVPVAQVQPNSTSIAAIAITNNSAFNNINAQHIWDQVNNWLEIAGFYYVS